MLKPGRCVGLGHQVAEQVLWINNNIVLKPQISSSMIRFTFGAPGKSDRDRTYSFICARITPPIGELSACASVLSLRFVCLVSFVFFFF